MRKKSKGELTRERILESSREIFNQNGIHLTLQELALEMGVSISFITNHFRTKELLFVSIAKEYEREVSHLSLVSEGKEIIFDFTELTILFSLVMDIQFEYRCAIKAVIASNNRQTAISKQIRDTYPDKKTDFLNLINALVDNKLVGPQLLEEKTQGVLVFQFMNLFTTWLVSLETYDSALNYAKLKSRYLTGIMWLFQGHLTAKGKRQFNKINFEKLAAIKK